MATYKLGVEVVGAYGLLPKDGKGSASACVELYFDRQGFRTAVKETVLNPVWNERFYFNVSDPQNLPYLALEADVYNIPKSVKGSMSFLGNVRIAGASFVPFTDAVVMHYPLEKRGIFSRVKGELGLKVYITNEATIRTSNPLPAMDHVSNNTPEQHRHDEVRTLHTMDTDVHHKIATSEAAMATYKLGVEVASAYDLLPKDGKGSASACVELNFDGQRFRTAVKEKDLNPVWNERFYFNVSDAQNLPYLALEAYVYNIPKSVKGSRSFLGKVRIAGAAFVPFTDAVVLHYPLEKRGIFSRVKGELGLKVYITNEATIRTSNPLPAMDHVSNNTPEQHRHDEVRTLHTMDTDVHHKIATSEAAMATYKLGVEVASAYDLLPKDGKGSASACVELNFDGQRFRTAVKEKDLNPVWNERFYFNVSDPQNLPYLALEAYVYNIPKSVEGSWSFLGKVRIAGTSFAPFTDAVVMHYPLEKRGIFSRVKGELGLKVYITNDATIIRPNPLPAMDTVSNNTPSPGELIAADITDTNVSNSQEHKHEVTTLHTMSKDVDHHIATSAMAMGLKERITNDTIIRASNSFELIGSSKNLLRNENTDGDPLHLINRFNNFKLESIFQDQSSRPDSILLYHLKEITDDFSHERIIGSGGSGMVYKGVLQNGEIIAVKKIVSPYRPDLQKQFENEVYHLMMLKHPNIVRFLGYCHETRKVCLEYGGKPVFVEMTEMLLCLEYLPKGSLDKYISDESCGLDWSTRYSIIEGICHGLCHLHENFVKPIIHMDLKPANILLDEGMVPKITDFGLSRLIDQHTICTSSLDGTFGYMAPEFLHGGIITSKSDIFSLGVIIIEVVIGTRDYPDVTRTSSDDFINLVLDKWRNASQTTLNCGSLKIDCEQIKRCIQLGLVCVNPDRTKRPPITRVISMLQGSESIDWGIINEPA